MSEAWFDARPQVNKKQPARKCRGNEVQAGNQNGSFGGEWAQQSWGLQPKSTFVLKSNVARNTVV